MAQFLDHLEQVRCLLGSMAFSFISIGGVDMSNSNIFEFENKKRKGNTSALEKSFNKTSRDQLDALIARMFYSAGFPFHLARNSHFIGAFTYATNNSLSGYKPLGYNMLGLVYSKEKMLMLKDY
ncbi:DUF659 domain-containing protein [Cucumis melo var. makuwa]|uniref:DUF659 domain-containing protein n=1 Tax=Cucumis melo var. makuwa TaxID=1194695 RepID=A0A5D3BEN8_CUCMM|nr:DUF659 domain-containing protein [Cucumis melo var. makuwa]TYJ98270.1 DUF659 domain-containing protein [Cucumis melo var. makuwa]